MKGTGPAPNALIVSQVERLLTPRRAVFGNMQQTNLLFDLVVVRSYGTFRSVYELPSG